MNNQHLEFDSAGIEGMIDVLCGCLFIFMLLAALVRMDSDQASETPLLDMDLSTMMNLPAGRKNTASVTLSAMRANGGVEIFLDQEQIPLENLKERLAAYEGVAQVALRRDPKLSVKMEDKIIAACVNAGVQNVVLIVKRSGGAMHE